MAVRDQLMAQAVSKIKKWDAILKNNGLSDQKEPFLISKNREKKEKKNNGALIL